MADEYQTSGNWWESSRTSRFEAGTSPSSSALNSLGSFGWSSTDMVDSIKARSPMDSVSVSGTSMVFHDIQKPQLQGSDSSGGGGAADPNLHMMGLGLSTQAMDWNQALFRGEKSAESSFRSILQENMNANANFQQEGGVQQQLQWRDHKLFAAAAAGGDSTSNRSAGGGGGGFSLDQSSQFSPQYSSGDSTITSSFQMDSAAAAAAALYGNQSTILQGLFGGTDTSNNNNNNNQQSSSSNSFPYPATTYGIGSINELPHHHHHHQQQQQPSTWSKVPQFLRTGSPPKQQQQQPYNHLHFSNNAPYWNASEAAIKEVRPGFFPSLQPQFPTQSFEEKPKNISEVRDSSAAAVVKKSGNEAASKRPRNETASPLPAFKVRKEKMGDRITALQQLVSPFGKTDTASVLSEAIEYIKFLHEQVTVLSTPYMKSGSAIPHQQSSDKSKDPEGPKQDLRSRGLCLVPVSSTFPVTHETTVDFWTPTFGGTYR
ncbi:transcription factor bHLH123 [Ziziphus jujuba]|uniref:Transcription factor bHLH123 n=1 Tax=Ziziphus jujuba TaxID=326968 RepID=A0ABM3IBL7_ZIZJJ|nr:transcription factor bHLH123 [Ziziphus jujuba]XP_048325619.1 transcription factor bHLH123 isoform X1 [Ziziphus jujuba var. spinosa]